LKRVIQKSLQDPLAEMILSGAVADGETLEISADAEGLTINGRKAARRAGDIFRSSGDADAPPPGALLN
jgi:ATP-dependent Clp protease ATP-binding subunit ClpB